MSGALTVLDLLDRARSSLVDACAATDVRSRYRAARLAALQSGVAVLAARTAPSRGSGPRDVWALLAVAAPELTEWADFFAVVATADRDRVGRAVTSREADDLLRSAESFRDLVRGVLDLPRPDDLPHRLAAARPA